MKSSPPRTHLDQAENKTRDSHIGGDDDAGDDIRGDQRAARGLLHLGRARHRPHRRLPWRLSPPARADQCVLQQGERRQVRAPRRAGGPLAQHHGQRAVRPLPSDLPPRQQRVRAVRAQQQLGQGALHRGRRAGGQRAGRREE